ncbi:MAG TPA: hypothetical protein PLG59_02685 [bacterium]|nr:hypothetical protein [bacterium]
MKRILISILVLLLIVLSFYVLFHFVFISDETRIQRRIEKGRAAIEKENLLTLAGLVSEKYRGNVGTEKSELLGNLHQLFQMSENIRIQVHSTEIRVNGTEADVSVRFTMSGTLDGKDFSGVQSGETETIGLRFAKEDRAWRVVEVTEPAQMRSHP